MVPKTNALSIRPQDPLITFQATIKYLLLELPPPCRSGENASSLQVSRVAVGIIFEMFPTPREAFTAFFIICGRRFSGVFTRAFTRLLQVLFTRLLRGFHNGFINMLQGVYIAAHKDCTRCFNYFREAFTGVLEFVYMVVTRCLKKCLQGVLQGVYKLFYKKCLPCFAMCSKGFYMVFARFFAIYFTRCPQGFYKAFARF